MSQPGVNHEKWGKRRYFTQITLLATAVVFTTLWWSFFREPRYQGRTVSSWVGDFDVNDGDAYVRAADAIQHIGPPAAPILLQLIRHQPAAKSTFGQSLIGALHINKIFPRASYLAQSDEMQVKACDALMVLGPQARCIAPELAGMVANQHPDDVFALTVLNTMGWEGLKLVTNEVPRVSRSVRSRVVLIGFLGDLGTNGTPAIPVLQATLKDSDLIVRSSAAKALGMIRQKPQEVVPALTVALADTNALVRQSAASSLGLYKQLAAPAMPALTRALQDPDSLVQAAAATALGNMRQEAAKSIPELVQLLENSNLDVRVSAGRALIQIGCTDFSATAAARKLSRELNVDARCAGVVLLWQLERGQAEGYTRVMECLNDPKNERTRTKTAEMLGAIGENARIFAPELAKALRDPSAFVRASATNALKSIDPNFTGKPKLP